MDEGIRHRIYQCTNQDCGLRFPACVRETPLTACPRCRSAIFTAAGPYAEHPALRPDSVRQRPEIEALLDNVRSLFNVGSMFRTADGAGLRHLHLCGITPTPDNPRLHKTALGAQEVVAWSHHPDGLKLAENLRSHGRRLWALEGGPLSEPLSLAPLAEEPIVLVIGNEVCGVDPGILELCERIFCIPMQGRKTSLNAAVAFGIAVYTLRSLGKGA